MFCDYSMLVTLCKISEVHFRLFGTNGFHVKAKCQRLTAAGSRCHENLKNESLTSSFGRLRQKIGPWGDMCLRVTNVTPLTLSIWLLTCFCNGRWQWMLVMLLNLLVWKQDGRFCRVPMFSRTGCAGLRKKGLLHWLSMSAKEKNRYTSLRCG